MAENQIDTETDYKVQRGDFGPSKVSGKEREDIAIFMRKLEIQNQAKQENMMALNDHMLRIIHGNNYAKEDIMETEREDKSDTVS